MCYNIVSAGNVSAAFPTPYDPALEVLPQWAIGVLAATVGITVFWIICVIILVRNTLTSLCIVMITALGCV